jgi:hypothetical protein
VRNAIGSRVAAASAALAIAACSPYSSSSSSVDGGSIGEMDSGPMSSLEDADTTSPEDAGSIHAGSALEFDGITAHVESPYVAIPKEFTLEAWVCPDQYVAANEMVIFAEDESNFANKQFRFGLDGTGHLYFVMSDALTSTHGLRTNSTNAFTSKASLPLGKFTHVAVTKSLGVFTLLINGQVDTMTSLDDFQRNGPAVQMRIGARVDSDGTSVKDPFKGTIDEVRLWSVARTSVQILEAMRTELPRENPDFDNLLSYWRFDEDAGAMTTDTKSGAAGNLVATPKWQKSTAF